MHTTTQPAMAPKCSLDSVHSLFQYSQSAVIRVPPCPVPAHPAQISAPAQSSLSLLPAQAGLISTSSVPWPGMSSSLFPFHLDADRPSRWSQVQPCQDDCPDNINPMGLVLPDCPKQEPSCCTNEQSPPGLLAQEVGSRVKRTTPLHPPLGDRP